MSKRLLFVVMLGLVGGLQATADTRVEISPAQENVPVGKGVMKPGERSHGRHGSGFNSAGSDPTIAGASDAEASRIARLKKQISDAQNANPVLDKLGPYLGLSY